MMGRWHYGAVMLLAVAAMAAAAQAEKWADRARELAEQRRQPQGRRRFQAAEMKRAARHAVVLRGGPGVGEQLGDAPDEGQDSLSGRRRQHAAGVTLGPSRSKIAFRVAVGMPLGPRVSSAICSVSRLSMKPSRSKPWGIRPKASSAFLSA